MKALFIKFIFCHLSQQVTSLSKNSDKFCSRACKFRALFSNIAFVLFEQNLTMQPYCRNTLIKIPKLLSWWSKLTKITQSRFSVQVQQDFMGRAKVFIQDFFVAMCGLFIDILGRDSLFMSRAQLFL